MEEMFVPITDEFRNDLIRELRKTDLNAKEITQSIGVRPNVISEIIRKDVEKVKYTTHSKIYDWVYYTDKSITTPSEKLLIRIEYDRLIKKGFSPDGAVEELGIDRRQLKWPKNTNISFLRNDLDEVDTTLAHQVAKANTRREKLNLIADYRLKLARDFDLKVMDMADNDPKLLALQLGNLMLEW